MTNSANAISNLNGIDQLSDDDQNDETRNFIPTPPPENMAVEDVRHKKHSKERKVPEYRPPWKENLYQHLTTAAHACVLLYVMLIIYFCFSGEFQFFTWHPLLLSTGWMFLMTEAILVMSKDNLLSGTLPKKIRVRLHWIFQGIAVTFITIGFAIIFINKNSLNKPHFKSWHGLLGFIGIVGCIPSCLNGVVALYHGDLKNYIHPKYSKLLHIASGTLTFVFGGAALILSVYTKWFERQSGGNILIFMVGLAMVVMAVAWTAFRPALSSIDRLKDILWEKRKN